ncbi:hypothetical protein [Lactiplantibacillus plantarum]
MKNQQEDFDLLAKQLLTEGLSPKEFDDSSFFNMTNLQLKCNK